jgi:acyl carrier protein
MAVLEREIGMKQKESEIFDRIVSIVAPFAKARAALASIAFETSFQRDLKVNSARLVDIMLEIEDVFDIRVKDEDADNVRTIGDAVSLVLRLKAAS